MRARQRFLKLSNLGSSAAYDARFIQSLNDGDSVSSWDDLTPSLNKASNSGSSRPIFKTSQFGGQPAVQFNSASSQKLNLTASISISDTSESLLVTRKTGSLLVGISNNFSSRGYNFFDYSDGNIYTTNSVNGAGCYSSNNGSSNSIWLIGPNSIFRLNGVSKTVNSLGGGFGTNTATTIGARNTEYSDGLIALIAYFPSTLTQSVRSMIEKATSFSFKIACS